MDFGNVWIILERNYLDEQIKNNNAPWIKWKN